MTGEMSWDDLKEYTDMLELVEYIRSELSVAAQLRPFDVYQGPYIAVSFDDDPRRMDLGGWNAKVWYSGEYPDIYVVEYKSVFSEELVGFDDVINYLNELIEVRDLISDIREEVRTCQGL